MRVKRIKARLATIKPVFFPQHEIDPQKVDRLVAEIGRGAVLPPVVVVDYSGTYMPVDGHHRLSAHQRLNRPLQAWMIDGETFEALDQACRDRCNLERAEDFIMCGGVPAMMVAPRRYG